MANTISPGSITQKRPIVIGGNTTSGGTNVGSTTTPAPVQVEITKFQFRKLFTLPERIAVDNAENNPALSPTAKATLRTLLKDVETSNVVQLGTPDVTAGINFLVQVGLLTANRATRILANLPPL